MPKRRPSAPARSRPNPLRKAPKALESGARIAIRPHRPSDKERPVHTARQHARKVLLVGNVFGRDLGSAYYMMLPKLLHGLVRLG